jgi:predicted alpha/beta superfamily hydrolase
MLEEFMITITPFNRERKIRAYLPNDYHTTNKKYPVLYMHDGQNLYRDEDASYGMCWGIKDYLDKTKLDLIVVGIDCNTEGYGRLDEYGPWENKTVGKELFNTEEIFGGEGKAYIDYITLELKPFIDKKYRTKSDDTSMAGSSMGGLISTYAACMYPSIFKKIASFSSAYWFNQKEIERLIQNSNLTSIEKFYLDVGTNESSGEMGNKRYIDSSKSVYSLLKEKIKDCHFEIIEDAVHNELAWRERVPDVFRYLF